MIVFSFSIFDFLSGEKKKKKKDTEMTADDDIFYLKDEARF